MKKSSAKRYLYMYVYVDRNGAEQEDILEVSAASDAQADYLASMFMGSGMIISRERVA